MRREKLVGSFLVTAALVSGGLARAQDETPYGRSFNLNRLDPRVAETWVWELCAEMASPREACRVVGVNEGDRLGITVLATSPVHARMARLLAERDSAIARTRTFTLTMLEATKSGSGLEGELSEDAKEALDDLRQLLPFRSFRVLDTVLVTTSRRGVARFSGPSGLNYEAVLSFRESESVDGPMLEVQQLEVQGEVIRDRALPPEGGGEAEESSRYKITETVLSTSLSMRPGETVVVGTSKLNGGDEALVVLLTAVAQ